MPWPHPPNRQSERAADRPAIAPQVWLVAAGPGDPELITLRALKLLQSADVIVYDRLVAPELLDHCRDDALKIYVGKQRNLHSVPQQDINALFVAHARRGLRVIRLLPSYRGAPRHNRGPCAARWTHSLEPLRRMDWSRPA